jgi:hypothetical protein
MSRIPSNTEQFMAGVQTGTQNLGQVSQNYQIASQRDLALRGLAQQERQMAQQGQQFERGLQAEAENYRKLNESRERMQGAEMEQQGKQFQQRMQFDQEQARLERLLGIKLKNMELDLAASEKELVSLADNDPRLQELRAQIRAKRNEFRNLEQMMGSAGLAKQLAENVQGQRMDEVKSRLTAHMEALGQRRDAVIDAVRAGMDYAGLKNAGKETFIDQVGRVSEAMQQYGVAGNVALALAGINPASVVIYDNIASWMLGSGAASEGLAYAKATEFMRDGGVMASMAVENAFDLHGGNFGLKPGDQEKAKALMLGIVSQIGILTNAAPSARTSDNLRPVREKIAQSVKGLREAGMGDEQIAGFFEGLESLGQNRAQILGAMDPSQLGQPSVDLMDRSLERVGKMNDIFEYVVRDKELMKDYGGSIADMSKYDMVETVSRAERAYGLGQSPEMEALMRDLDFMRPEDRARIMDLLTREQQGLQNLRPEYYQDVLMGGTARRGQLGSDVEALDEILARTQAQLVAGGQAAVYRGGQDRLAEIARLLGE